MTSEAWKEYLIKVPTDKREFRTIEIFHPDFSSVLRFVRDYEDQILMLESDAPRNPSSLVLFEAIHMDVHEPGEKPNTGAVLTVNLGAVGNQVEDQVSQITPGGLLTPVEVIYRRYYEGDTSAPVLVFNLSAAHLKFDSYKGVAFTAQDVNLTTKPAGEIYTLERFPGLRGI